MPKNHISGCYAVAPLSITQTHFMACKRLLSSQGSFYHASSQNSRKFLEDDEDWDLKEKIIQEGHKLPSGPGIVTVDMVRDQEDDKPMDAAAVKTQFSPFDVTQKLFKEGIGKYDKKHHDISDLRSMGTRTKLIQSWYNALSPDVLEELRLVAEKWNEEGAHSDVKDRYCSQHQKKLMEDFIKMAGRTMGLHLVILAAHDQGEGKMPGTTIWESCPRKLNKTFTLTSKENKKWAGESQDCLADWLTEAEYNICLVSFTALKELENYIIRSCGLGMIVVLVLGLLLHECHCAQEYEADKARDDVPDYLGTSILGIQVGEKIEEAITRIQVKVKAMLPDDHERQIEEAGRAGKGCCREEAAEEKRAAEEACMAKERAATLKKASGTKAGGKRKGKQPATDVNDSPMKKMKTGPSTAHEGTVVPHAIPKPHSVKLAKIGTLLTS
ncbi:uncharacterized protein BJ212DRAFT_1477894 [Suillus subaureus]|uniref:Uncharacterized protein n=1 Tax=Suillus subaureus TaxID=48587 RepID=A0A9P7EJ46_9AGAM|nr:uncharacterized protein BJ212DRAFT_1477894 [Suillus subaureus]KAG1822065.1 hypothetical protein BJ212DRAFT_1477894 [Suillus subaureus]